MVLLSSYINGKSILSELLYVDEKYNYLSKNETLSQFT